MRSSHPAHSSLLPAIIQQVISVYNCFHENVNFNIGRKVLMQNGFQISPEKVSKVLPGKKVKLELTCFRDRTREVGTSFLRWLSHGMSWSMAFNGHDSGTNEDWRYLPCVRPYVSGLFFRGCTSEIGSSSKVYSLLYQITLFPSPNFAVYFSRATHLFLLFEQHDLCCRDLYSLSP